MSRRPCVAVPQLLYRSSVAWTFSGAFLDGFAGERVVSGTGEQEELPGRYALAGLVDAHAHPTVETDEHGPFLADIEYGAARLEEYAFSGVTVIRDVGGRSRVTLGFARSTAAGRPVVTAAGRFLAPANRYFPRMHSPVAPDELVPAIEAEVTAGAAWVKIIGDAPEWGADGPVPQSTAATYDLDTLRQAVDAAHAAGARVAVHSNLPDSGLAAIGADSIEHGKALSHSEIEALGARGGAWTPTLCAVLRNRDSPILRSASEQTNCANDSATTSPTPSPTVSGYWPAPMSSAQSRMRSRSWPITGSRPRRRSPQPARWPGTSSASTRRATS